MDERQAWTYGFDGLLTALLLVFGVQMGCDEEGIDAVMTWARSDQSSSHPLLRGGGTHASVTKPSTTRPVQAGTMTLKTASIGVYPPEYGER